MSSVSTRGGLTDRQWKHLRKWIPAPARRGRPITRPRRQLVNGIAWRVRVGSPWRDVPGRFGPWPTVYWLFRTWQLAGTWVLLVRMLLRFTDTNGALTWEISVDSTTVRAHISAAGAGKQPVPGEPDDHALGRSRGGWTTKLHLATDASQQVMAMTLTPGQAGDSPQFQKVLNKISVPRPGPGRPRTRPLRVLADKAGSSPSDGDTESRRLVER